METVGVAAAVESVSGKIYAGVCVDGGSEVTKSDNRKE